MKAAQIKEYSQDETIFLNNDVSMPKIGEDQLLVEVFSASINPFDSIIMKGYVKDLIKTPFPFTIGGDFSGRVLEVGQKVIGFKQKDEVFGTALILAGGSGSFAEFAAVSPDRVALKPKNLNYNQAASLPLVGSSAVQTLEDEMKLASGQKILIHGGTGGIGSISIQLAKHLGAYVATTVSKKDVDFVKNLGADEVIDYKSEKFEERLKDYDAVYDTVGGETTNRSFSVLKKGGIIASMKGPPDEELSKKYQVLGVAINTKVNTEHLNRVKELVEENVIGPQVDKIFSLDEIKEAFVYKSGSHPRGKVVVRIRS